MSIKEAGFRFTRFFTGGRGDHPIIEVTFEPEVTSHVRIKWLVRDDFTGWKCSYHVQGGCDHSDAVEQMLPVNLRNYMERLEDLADAGEIRPKKRNHEAIEGAGARINQAQANQARFIIAGIGYDQGFSEACKIANWMPDPERPPIVNPFTGDPVTLPDGDQA